MKIILTAISLILLFVIVIGIGGCFGTIETGNVGVRTAWDGEVYMQEEHPGFYVAVFDSVREYSAREIAVELRGMKPKAKDNLSLENLDLEVFYKANGGAIAELAVQYSDRDEKGARGVWMPAYHLVYSVARSATYDAVAGYNSLELHRNRELLSSEIIERIVKALEEATPGAFSIERIVIRDVRTDKSVEQAISLAVAKEKEEEAKKIEVRIAALEAQKNRELTASLTPQVLQNRQLEVLQMMVEKGNIKPIVLIGSGNAPALILNDK